MIVRKVIFLLLPMIVLAQSNPCDLGNFGSVTTADVTLAVQMATGQIPCIANIEGPNVCTAITVQRVTDAEAGAHCITYNTHATTLTWVASTSPNVIGYWIYRSTVSLTGPFGSTPINLTLVTTTTYTDTAVVAGQTYYYVATAQNTTNQQSGDSNPVTATIPTP